MKQIQIIIALLLTATTVNAQTEKITIRTSNFARPLIEKLATEYSKSTPNADVKVISSKPQTTDNFIQVVTDADGVFFARYAVLPIIAYNQEALQIIGTNRLNTKKIKELLFEKDNLSDDKRESKLAGLHVYTGASQYSAARLYANKLGRQPSEYRGKRIQGDDIYINSALTRDALSVGVNSLSNIYNIESRQLVSGIALLPIDADKRSRQILDTANLDGIIALLEQRQIDEIPTGRVGFSYNKANAALNNFVHWVLTDGVQYLHKYGLLQLQPKDLAEQRQFIEQKELAQNEK